MSRHRNIRSMNYTDEYDGYDDVYGHSVEDDYCISPSDAAFMYDREGTRNQPTKIGAFLSTENDIAEEEEGESSVQDTLTALSAADREKLETCLNDMRITLGPDVSKDRMIQVARSHNFNPEKSINYLLDVQTQDSNKLPKKEKVAMIAVLPASAAISTDLPPTTTILDIRTPTPSTPSSTKVQAAPVVTKGFDLPQTPVTRLAATPRSQSPASGRVTPTVTPIQQQQTLDGQQKAIDAAALYRKERSSSKEQLHMIVIGHVDAGKSTLMGHLLWALGQVNSRTMHKYEQESKKLGKQSFVFAWVLDETGEERSRGITMDVGRFQFETDCKCVTLMDAPGHKDFIPNMIAGAGQADVALLVVDATRGEFETGFDLGGQTREHALLVRSLGVSQIAVAINKLDTVSWAQARFDEVRDKMRIFLKQAGFKESDVTFVPCSGLSGQNLIKEPTEDALKSWYSGPTLLEVINNFRSPERPISKPFRLSVNDIFKGTGSGFCVSGRIETGCLSVGDRVLVCPNREMAIVKALSIDEIAQQVAFVGDQPAVTLSGVEMQNVGIGNILCDPASPVPISTRFQARIVVFNISVPLTKGFSVVLHHQSLVEPAIISKLVAQLNKSNGEILKKHPRYLGKHTSAMVEVQVSRPIAVEMYSDCKELGRVMLRVGGVTIAAGLITKVIL